jgi:hypothetical protein
MKMEMWLQEYYDECPQEYMFGTEGHPALCIGTILDTTDGQGINVNDYLEKLLQWKDWEQINIYLIDGISPPKYHRKISRYRLLSLFPNDWAFDPDSYPFKSPDAKTD